MNRTKITPAHLLLGLCLLFPLLAMAQETKTFTARFADGDFVLGNDADGCVTINSGNRDAVLGDDVSKPGLPYVSFNLLIAPNQTCSDVTFTILEKVKVKSGVTVAPNPTVYPTDGSVVPSEGHAPVAYTDDVYPEKSVEYAGLNKMDGYRFLGFNVCPFIYDAANRDLYFVKSLTVTATLNTDVTLKIQNRSVNIGQTMSDIVKGAIENKDDFDRLYGSVLKTKSLNTIDTNRDIEYLLITNNALAKTFKDLCDWKTEKGVPAEIKTVEYIKENYPGETVQLQIKNCIHDYYLNHGVKYVLLGGDDAVVPVMKCYAESEKGQIVQMPTDLYYACFDDNFEWNANGNNLYGEIEDQIDMAPEVFLTRAPVRNTADIWSFINKVLRYEQELYMYSWKKNILMCGAESYYYYTTNDGRFVSDSQGKSEAVYSASIRHDWDGQRTRFYDTETDFPEGANYELNSKNFQEQLASGNYSFVDMESHGFDDLFALENGDTYRADDALALENNTPMMIITAACNTNAFDSGYEPCLSEAFIRNERSGVVAYWGCSREGFTNSNPDYKNLGGPSESFNMSFYRALFEEDGDGCKEFGTIATIAKNDKLNNRRSKNYRWLLFGINPVGDPEMPIFYQEPKEFENVSLNFDGENLTVDTGLEGCRICVMSSDFGKKYYSVAKDVQKATFTGLCDGEIDICVTKPGYMPDRYISFVQYIQNETIHNKKNVIQRNSVLIGSDVTDEKEYGPVIIEEGGNLNIKECESIIINGDFEVKTGGELNIE